MIDRVTQGRELSADRTDRNGRNDSARNALLMLRIPDDDGQEGTGRIAESVKFATRFSLLHLKLLRKPSENISSDLHDRRIASPQPVGPVG